METHFSHLHIMRRYCRASRGTHTERRINQHGAQHVWTEEETEVFLGLIQDKEVTAIFDSNNNAMQAFIKT